MKMSVRLAHLRDLSEEEIKGLFPTNQFLLGDQKGNWFCIDNIDKVILARYKNREDAITQAASYKDIDYPTDTECTEEELLEAMEYAKKIEEDL